MEEGGAHKFQILWSYEPVERFGGNVSVLFKDTTPRRLAKLQSKAISQGEHEQHKSD